MIEIGMAAEELPLTKATSLPTVLLTVGGLIRI
jgi:hypothetical protein